jgi:putative hemolysin
MEHWTVILLLAIFILLIILSAFFSGTETALLAFPPHRLRYYSKKYRDQAQNLKNILRHPHDFIATVLICNNFVNVAASSIATYLCVYYFGNKGVLISTLSVTAVLLIFAEITPKTYAATRTDILALKVAKFLSTLIRILKPISRLTSSISYLLIRTFTPSHPKHPEPHFDEEMKSFIHTGREKGLLNQKESLMINNILGIEKTTVKEIMVPRQVVAMIQLHTPHTKFLSLIQQVGYSRYPVYGKNREDIIGIMHIKDLLIHKFGKTFSLKQIIRPAHFIPEIMPLDSLLETFRQEKTRLAIVVDEYGGMEGLVTMEDVVEEIIGEMNDEVNVGSPAEIISLKDGSYLVRADIPIRRLNLDIPFLEVPEEDNYFHLAGFILSQLGNIPTNGDVIEIPSARLEVIRVIANKIVLIRIIPVSASLSAS